MFKRYIALFVFGIVLLLIVVGFLFFQSVNTQQTSKNNDLLTKDTIESPTGYNSFPVNNGGSSAPKTPVAAVSSPTDITKFFYSWYISAPTNPVKSGAYKSNRYLSDQFKEQIAAFSGNSQLYDPVLCSKNKSENVTYGDPEYNGLAKVAVSANVPNGKDLYRFVLKYSRGQWSITDIICIP